LEVQPSSLASRTTRPATASIPGRRIEMDAYSAPSHDSLAASEVPETEPLGPPDANRHHLPDERPAITHHFAVGGHEGYLTVGLYPNGHTCG
ncbi:MAG TPA: hypothetical protein VFN62_05520, partial [Acidobacteriaceae bacterium]|nr:hypothetical protein [Acidobacteriaceae bacterium]